MDAPSTTGEGNKEQIDAEQDEKKITSSKAKSTFVIDESLGESIYEFIRNRYPDAHIETRATKNTDALRVITTEAPVSDQQKHSFYNRSELLKRQNHPVTISGPTQTINGKNINPNPFDAPMNHVVASKYRWNKIFRREIQPTYIFDMDGFYEKNEPKLYVPNFPLPISLRAHMILMHLFRRAYESCIFYKHRMCAKCGCDTVDRMAARVFAEESGASNTHSQERKEKDSTSRSETTLETSITTLFSDAEKNDKGGISPRTKSDIPSLKKKNTEAKKPSLEGKNDTDSKNNTGEKNKKKTKVQDTEKSHSEDKTSGKSKNYTGEEKKKKKNKKSRVKKCFGCGYLTYCSKKCQQEDWKEFHRFECENLKNAGELLPNFREKVEEYISMCEKSGLICYPRMVNFLLVMSDPSKLDHLFDQRSPFRELRHEFVPNKNETNPIKRMENFMKQMYIQSCGKMVMFTLCNVDKIEKKYRMIIYPCQCCIHTKCFDRILREQLYEITSDLENEGILPEGTIDSGFLSGLEKVNTVSPYRTNNTNPYSNANPDTTTNREDDDSSTSPQSTASLIKDDETLYSMLGLTDYRSWNPVYQLLLEKRLIKSHYPNLLQFFSDRFSYQPFQSETKDVWSFLSEITGTIIESASGILPNNGKDSKLSKQQKKLQEKEEKKKHKLLQKSSNSKNNDNNSMSVAASAIKSIMVQDVIRKNGQEQSDEMENQICELLRLAGFHDQQQEQSTQSQPLSVQSGNNKEDDNHQISFAKPKPEVKLSSVDDSSSVDNSCISNSRTIFDINNFTVDNGTENPPDRLFPTIKQKSASGTHFHTDIVSSNPVYNDCTDREKENNIFVHRHVLVYDVSMLNNNDEISFTKPRPDYKLDSVFDSHFPVRISSMDHLYVDSKVWASVKGPYSVLKGSRPYYHAHDRYELTEIYTSFPTQDYVYKLIQHPDCHRWDGDLFYPIGKFIYLANFAYIGMKLSVRGLCASPSCKNGSNYFDAKLKCTGCHILRYCSKECQKENWKMGHREMCQRYCSEYGSEGSHSTGDVAIMKKIWSEVYFRHSRGIMLKDHVTFTILYVGASWPDTICALTNIKDCPVIQKHVHFRKRMPETCDVDSLYNICGYAAHAKCSMSHVLILYNVIESYCTPFVFCHAPLSFEENLACLLLK